MAHELEKRMQSGMNESVSEWGGDELLKCTEGRTTKTPVTYDATQVKSLVLQLYEIV